MVSFPRARVSVTNWRLVAVNEQTLRHGRAQELNNGMQPARINPLFVHAIHPIANCSPCLARCYELFRHKKKVPFAQLTIASEFFLAFYNCSSVLTQFTWPFSYFLGVRYCVSSMLGRIPRALPPFRLGSLSSSSRDCVSGTSSNSPYGVSQVEFMHYYGTQLLL